MTTVNADLHSHSTVSDGLLSPAEMASRAKANGVELWALTDHDEIAGLAAAQAQASAIGLRFVNGAEVSVSLDDDQTIHVVALGFDAGYAPLIEGLARVRGGRDARAQSMAAELDKVGIHGAYEGALRYAGNPALVSRAHFARYIVELGHAKEVKNVFDHWLAKGKPGYVPHPWATLEEALGWIRGAGGLAVLAHPGRYRLGKAKLRTLLGTFRDLGGRGIEVLSGSHNEEQAREYGRHAQDFGFLASLGSDFHGPGESWMDLGKLPPLPEGLTPVWTELI